ncbi:MAG: adenylate kinase [Candidatus Margulisbacteria bacterium GWF2_35_9]|nr:MAG: adenylate kinase [Candidatus Margulisbacteria bacterium GWF2_35_9]
MKKVLLLGAPGSGKGTQAKYLVDEFSFKHIAMGDILRQEVADETELGKEAKSYMNQGALVPDDVVNNIVLNKLQSMANTSYLLDGFPRTIPQAKFLEDNGEAFDLVIYFHITLERVLDRMSGRLTCKTCGASFHKKYNKPTKENICDNCGATLIVRDDDKPETVKKRYETYINQTEPLLSHYNKFNIVFEVNAEDDINIIQEKIKERIIRK